ncbi:MAG: hypothetical protein KDD04_02970 [Sinomicrobium sp.]|nr:hypothetical protein [Sinomicrobium sp.]
MKINYNLVVLLLLASVTTAVAQYSYTVDKIASGDVPEAVSNAFENGFPGAKTVRWEKHTGKGKNNRYVKYVVVFDKDGIRSRARYKTDGKGISATTYYWFKKGVAKLPQPVKDYAADKHPDFELNSGEKVISLKSSASVYRIRLRKGASKLVVYVNASGEMINKNNLPSELTEDEDEN